MADGLKRIEDIMGWSPKETVEKFHAWWKEDKPEDFEQYKGEFGNVEDEDYIEYVLSGFEATYKRRNAGSGSDGPTEREGHRPIEVSRD